MGATLRLDLDIVESARAPKGNRAPALLVIAVAERGKQPLVPRPLVRVARGTVVVLTLSNRSDSALVIGDLRPGVGGDANTLQIVPGAMRELRDLLDVPGAYANWGLLPAQPYPIGNGKIASLAVRLWSTLPVPR